VLLALTPVAVLQVWSIVTDRAEVEARAALGVERLSVSVAGEAQSLLSGTTKMLAALGEEVARSGDDGAYVSSLLADVHARFPEYANISAVRQSGDVFASSPSLTNHVSQADIAGFQQAVAERRTVIERPRVSRTSGMLVIPVRHPVVDATGEVAAVVCAGIDLDRFERDFESLNLPPGSSAAIIAGDGQLVVRYPTPADYVDAERHPGVTAIGAEAPQVATGLDGIENLYAATKIRGLGDAEQLYAIVGVPTHPIAEEQRGVLLGGLAQLGMIVLTALVGAAFGSEVLVNRPIAYLVNATRRFGSGETDARAPVGVGGRETEILTESFNEMADALGRREAALCAAVDEFESFFSLNLELFCIARSDGTFARWNHEWSDVLGYPSERFDGARLVEFVHADDRERVEASLAQRGDGDRVGAFVCRCRHADGTYLHLSFRIAPSADGERVYIAARDITARVESERALLAHQEHLAETVESKTAELRSANEELASVNEELEAGNEELAAANQELQAMYAELAATTEALATANQDLGRANSAKSDFLASMSHELRTPLNSVIGFSDLMLQGMVGPVSEEQQRQLGMINHAGKHLLELINDVLDLSRIEAGRLSPHPEEFAAQDELAPLIEMMRASAEGKGLTLGVDIPVEPLELCTDARMVKQVLLNLLGNAIKFTDAGEVLLTVEPLPRARVRLSVADTGHGIESKDLEHIFEAFAQLELPRQIKPGGTGLGLTISASLARLLGGELTVESTAGEGSTFALVIPARLAVCPVAEDGATEDSPEG
jgi:PAS domain S-box-containing protein